MELTNNNTVTLWITRLKIKFVTQFDTAGKVKYLDFIKLQNRLI